MLRRHYDLRFLDIVSVCQEHSPCRNRLTGTCGISTSPLTRTPTSTARLAPQLEKRPALRALEKVVSEEGFKTVVTLRLAPVLPIPLGAYNYGEWQRVVFTARCLRE